VESGAEPGVSLKRYVRGWSRTVAEVANIRGSDATLGRSADAVCQELVEARNSWGEVPIQRRKAR
jgi:hypothetical protein